MAVPAGMRAIAEKSHQTAPWIWLLRLEATTIAEGLPPVLIPITTYTAEVTWPPTGPTAQQYYPFAFQFERIDEGGKGELPQIDVVFDNSTRVLMDMAHQCGGFEGATVKLVLVHEASLATLSERMEWEFEVLSSSATEKVFTLRLGLHNYFLMKSPHARFIANRCRYLRYGGEECGYVVNEVAAFTSCDRTLAACRARGDDEVARNLPRLHPLRYGGFPGIAAQRQQ